MSIRSLTQEDPIGLAGGLNLYGFANGDPVNFSDPYGLCPECRLLLPAAGTAAAADGPVPVGDVVGAGLVVGAGILATKHWIQTGGPQALAGAASSLFAKGLSLWDRIKIIITIGGGNAATKGKLQEREIERHRIREEQVQDQKEQQPESGHEPRPPENKPEPE
ncbi:MAG: RHS repeat domain-containing protein [Gammaproteobacteria bacterium]